MLQKLYLSALISIVFISSEWFYPLAVAATRDLFPNDNQKDTLSIVSKIALAKQFYYADAPNYDSTFTYLNQALDLSKVQSDVYYAYIIYELYSEILYKNGNYRLAVDYYFKMLHLLDQAKEQSAIPELKREQAILYRNIGICLSYTDTEKALNYFRKSLEKVEEIGKINPNYPAIDEIRSWVYSYMGAAWRGASQFDSASFYCQKALTYPAKINNAPYYASLYDNLGFIQWKLKNQEEALDYYRKALDIHQQLGDLSGAAQIHYELGLCYFQLNRWDEASSELLAAVEKSRKSGNIQIEMYAIEALAKIYEQQDDFYKAAQMFQLYGTLTDSVSNRNRINELSQIKMQYSLEKQSRESELNRQFALNREESKTWKILSISIFLLPLFVIILLLSLNQRTKNKKNLLEKQYLLLQNENLELKNWQLNQSLHKSKEQNSSTAFLPNKNQPMEEKKEENIFESKEADSDPFKSVDKDTKAIGEDPVWNEYSVLLQHLPQNFYNNLQQQHPNLTPNEKKLSAFIRLNMSSKDISSITFQSVKSIEIARSRLRQKLKLKRDTNLNAYLQGF
ncbi:MAG: tetratricopeptide repeat protein [Candidatus Azobacteroides sp.]|nr:tetratricopeptide repeat protein [Candidatus Azobacteroides sp.]